MPTKKSDRIEHPGVVERVEDNRVFVQIESQASCGHCQAKSHCGMVESVGKTVEVVADEADRYRAGQKVLVAIERSLGYKALLLGYIYPFLIMLITLFALTLLTGNEGLSALIAALLMVPYYAGLYHYKNRLRKTFTFRIRESNAHISSQ